MVVTRTLASFVAILILLGSSGEANDSLVKADWIDFAYTSSPIFRPVEPLILAKNGTVSSSDRKTKVEVGSYGSLGRVVWWKVDASSDANGWAVARIAFPERARGKVRGVTLKLVAPKPIELSFDAYTNVPGPNFQEAWLVGSMKRKLVAGVNDVEFVFADVGIPNIESLQGFGLSFAGRMDGPIEVGFSKIRLLFADASEAKEFELAPLRVTTEILHARGVNLKKQLGKLPNPEIDRRCWQGFQLVAIGEQINYWRLLARKLRLPDRESANLSRDRAVLIARLQNSKSIDSELAGLQRRVDSWVDRWMAKIPIEKRRWYLGKDKRFHYPDGRPYRMFAPYPFRMDWPNKDYNVVIPWDIRYIAALGFNGIRMTMQWDRIEPKRGKLEQWYVNQLIWIARECERYGMGVSVDLHFNRPGWFIRGVPDWGYVGKDIQSAYASGYHWPQALAETWGNLAKAFRNLPNTVAWEVPMNEPMVVNGKNGITAFPSLNRSWNEFLKKTYGTRDNLKKAWSCAVNSNIYGLKDDEDWDTNSIRWMVVEEKPDVQANYADNPRLWDHLRWVAHLQRSVTDLIMTSIRKHVPGAVGMMHRTIGDNWDGCPVPIDYTAIETIRGKHVCPGTHYGMAGLSAIRAASQTYASFDTEQQMRGLEKLVEDHVKLGLGFCPFWLCQGGYAHETILGDDYGHMEADTAYLAIKSDWIRNYWPPEESNKPGVAVILSTRLEAVRQGRLGELLTLLKELGCRVGVFNGLEVVMRPELLKGYKAVITPTSYMDVDLLGVLQDKFKGIVLLHGSLQRDALARDPEHGLAAEMVKRGILLRDPRLSLLLDSIEDKIDLTGLWDFKHTRGTVNPKSGPPTGKVPDDWSKMPVPSYWDGTGALAFTPGRNVLGDAWYRRDVKIPADWSDKLLTIRFGAIDDYDWVYFNGKLVGFTDENTSNAWVKARSYPIPPELVKPGETNEIAVLVRNSAVDGGIWLAPAEIVAQARWQLTNGPFDGMTMFPGPQASRVTRSHLAENAEVVALIQSGEKEAVGLARQGRWYWWASDFPWMNSKVDRAVLQLALTGIGVGNKIKGNAK